MPKIDLRVPSLHYELTGNPANPVLVLSHSLGTNLSMWEPQREALEQHFYLLRYDMRGHGLSDVPPGPYSMDQCGGDVVALLDALKIDQVNFCGLSVGGMIGQWLGIHAPTRLRKLMLCNTAAKIGTEETWKKRIYEVQTDGLASIADRVLQGWFTADFLQSGAPVVAAMREMLVTSPPDGYIATSAAIRDVDLRTQVSSIQTPTCILAGLFDPSTTLADAHFLEAQIAGSQVVTLPTAHISSAQAPAEFNSALLDFFL